MRKLLAVVLGLSLSPVVFAYSFAEEFDREKAKKALRDLGADIEGSTGRCAGCHDPNLLKVNDWVSGAVMTIWACKLDVKPGSNAILNPEQERMDAEKKINCMRENPLDPRTPFSVKKMGLLAAGAHLSDFKNLFIKAYGSTGEGQWQNFVFQVSMPKNSQLMNEAEWKNLMEWVTWSKSAPYLEELLGGGIQAPSECVPSISQGMKDYIKKRRNDSWASRNLESGLRMFACENTNPLDCFKQKRSDGSDVFPKADAQAESSDWFANGVSARVLTTLNFRPNYWTRSSPDGRFIGNGFSDDSDLSRHILPRPGGWDGRITDLAAELDPTFKRKEILVEADYDPTFFPDNSGFLFQSSQGGYCNQFVLEDPKTERIDFKQRGCNLQNGVGLYQSVGASLGRGDYVAVNGQFESDSGVAGNVNPPSWLLKSYLSVSHIIHNGMNYEVKASHTAWTPFKGDYQMSPSTDLIVSRVSGTEGKEFVQRGFSIERMTLDLDAHDEAQVVKTEELARICQTGGKASFSFDERFLVYYDEVEKRDFAEFGFADADDPRFVSMIGLHNIYLTDLYSGETKRITTMDYAYSAKFPHFRSDGWIYFLVTDPKHGKHKIMATDAALHYAPIQ